MELTLEAYREVVKYVGNRADIAMLCRVSKTFRQAAERALYNTLYMCDVEGALLLCTTLSTQPRVAMYVDALTIHVADESSTLSDDENSNGGSQAELPDGYWITLSLTLRNLTRLRYFNIYIGLSAPTSTSWILDGCTFQLRGFHCDFDWNDHLVMFLNLQRRLVDLYILDYHEIASPDPPSSPSSEQVTPVELSPGALPKMSILECTFIEAAVNLARGRPLKRLKTCFSRQDVEGKAEELSALSSALTDSTSQLRSLDIADSTYIDSFSITVSREVVKSAGAVRYLGTLALPIDGDERLRFYGFVRSLTHLRCIELEISAWDPLPESLPAFRALMGELRIYRPSIVKVIFVHNFERTVISYDRGAYWIEENGNPETFWREI